MKPLYYVLVLFIISTVYLFSQSEKNEIIRVDTVVIEQQEKKDFKKYDFYNDYLADLKKTGDTLAIKRNDMEIPYISSVKIGAGLPFGIVSFGMDIPIYYRLSIVAELGCCVGGIEGIFADLYYGLGLGYIAVRTRNDKFILKLNSYICKISHLSTEKGFDTDKLTFHIGSDILFKMSKHTYISFGVASFIVQSTWSWEHKIYFVPQISLGLNVMI